MTTERLTVGVLGAGAVGCYVGILLSAAGHPVVLVGRRSIVEARDRIRAAGLDGQVVAPGADLAVADDVKALEDCDVCLVTVKSRDTLRAAAQLSDAIPGDSVVVSLQNGLRNADKLRSVLSQTVVAAMVSYNVYREGDLFRQLTSGPLVAGAAPASGEAKLSALAGAFAAAGQPLELRSDIEDVLLGKLLLNLNNGICALTGLSIVEALANRDVRWCYSQAMKEALAVSRVAGRKPAKVVALPPGAIARLLMLPDAVFLRLARSMVQVDERARLSTLQDLEAGKPTEVDDLNGEIVRLAVEHDTRAPVNALIVDTVHELERAGLPPPFLAAREVRRRIEEVLGAS